MFNKQRDMYICAYTLTICKEIVGFCLGGEYKNIVGSEKDLLFTVHPFYLFLLCTLLPVQKVFESSGDLIKMHFIFGHKMVYLGFASK